MDHTIVQLLYIPDFSLYSIGIILTRLKKLDASNRFSSDIIIEFSVNVARLDPEDMKKIIETEREFDPDFDDSLQYVTAERPGLFTVSLNSDFDKTEKARIMPEKLLERKPF
jgi:predicted nucleic acid-binding protein